MNHILLNHVTCNLATNSYILQYLHLYTMAEHYPISNPTVDPVDHHIAQYVPHYATCNTRVVATGKKGRAPGEFDDPCGVAIHEETHQIFVANFWNHRVEIFSETEEFFHQLGVGQLSRPWGIAIHGDSVYVSCFGDHTVSKFSLTELCHIRRIGGEGSNNGQFNYPHQLTTDPIGCVFIVDSWNDRICIHDPDLNNLRNITHPSMSLPYDVKVSRDRLYVLCPDDNPYLRNNPCLLVLTLERDKLHSLITCGEGMDVLYPYFFCLDHLNNFALSDHRSHSIRVFSPEGNLLHTIGREGYEQGMLYLPRGIAISPNGRIVCVSSNKNYNFFLTLKCRIYSNICDYIPKIFFQFLRKQYFGE